MANRENDLQAWYHSVCPEVYRRKRESNILTGTRVAKVGLFWGGWRCGHTCEWCPTHFFRENLRTRVVVSFEMYSYR